MFAATTSPSYSPTWVSGQTPVTSPIAQRRSPARRCSSTGMPRGSASTPTVSRPIPSTRGRRPVATSSRSPRSSRPSSNSRTYSSPSRRAAVACIPSMSSIPSRRRASPSASPSGAGSRAARGRRPRRAPPRRRDGARPAPARRPPGRRPARAGGGGRPSCPSPRGCPRRPRARRRPGIGRHDRIRAGRHDDVLRGVADTVDLDDARCRPAGRCRAAGRCRGPPASAPGRRRSSSRP